MSLQHNPVIVLGTRVAASTIASQLRALGVRFEDGFRNLDRQLLATFGLRPDSVEAMPENWRSHPAAEQLRVRLRSLISSSTEPDPCAIEPSSAAILQIYAQTFDDLGLEPQCLYCIDDPEALETSQQLGLWLRDVSDSLRFAKLNPVAIITSSREIEAGTQDKVRLLFPGLTKVDLAIVSNKQSSGTADSDLPKLVRDLYRWCCEPQQDWVKLEPLLQESESWRRMLAPPKLPGTRIGFAWHTRGGVASALEPFMPSPDWQVVTINLPAPPETEINGLLYSRPCRVWIRRFHLNDRAAQLVPGPGSVLTQHGDLLCLAGAYEARQISFMTPRAPGPYTLQLEFLLESESHIAAESIVRSAENLHRCLNSRVRAGRPEPTRGSRT